MRLPAVLLVLCNSWFMQISTVFCDHYVPVVVPPSTATFDVRTKRHASAVSASETTNNIQFEMSDFEVEHQLEDGSSAILQAYRVRSPSAEVSQWVSVGCPTFVKNNHGHLLTVSSESIGVYMQILESSQRQALMEKARRLFQLDPMWEANDVIRPLPLTQILCRLEFVQDGNEYRTIGRAIDLNKNPVRLIFNMTTGSEIRMAFEKRLLIDDELRVSCDLESIGGQDRVASLTITADQIRLTNLTDKLFGYHRNETFLSRRQTAAFSGEIMTALRIEEQYDTDVEEFREYYTQELIRLSRSDFGLVSFDEVTRGLSAYGRTAASSGRYQYQNEIKNQFTSAFRIDLVSGRRLLTTNRDSRPIGTETDNVFDAFDGNDDLQFVQSRRTSWYHTNLFIDHQVSDLNNRSPKGSIKWRRVGNTIEPTELQVLRLSRASFGQTIRLKRVRRRQQSANFKKTFALDLNPRHVRQRVDPDQQDRSDPPIDRSLIVEEAAAEALRRLRNQTIQQQSQCRSVNGTGFKDYFSTSLVATINALSMIENFDINCITKPTRNLTTVIDDYQLKLIFVITCNDVGANKRTWSVDLGLVSYYNMVSAKSLTMLSAQCDSDEHMTGYRYMSKYDTEGLVLWPEITCCKMTYSFVEEY